MSVRRLTYNRCGHPQPDVCKLLLARRKLEEWTDNRDTGQLKLEVKPGEEFYLEQLIRFCYSRQVTLTEGQQA